MSEESDKEKESRVDSPPACSGVIRAIPQQVQSHRALSNQISLLWAAANRLGLYDAADFIRPYMAGGERSKGPNDQQNGIVREDHQENCEIGFVTHSLS